METKTDILNELFSISPLIAGINRVNIFTVPQGYLDSIIGTVLACLQEENTNTDLIYKNPSADIPKGYFDQLATSILNKIKTGETAAEEISNLSPFLHSIQNKNVFEVPDGYFESIDQLISIQLKTATPKEELKGLSPLLDTIQSKNVFEVPDEYFTGLAENILKKVQPPVAKVIVMHKRNLFIKYAVAAMMTGVLALGLYRYIDKPVSPVSQINTVATLDATVEKGKNMNDKQFNEALENLTEADIAKYLEKNGDITDVAVLGNNIEESNLPSQEDYLLDEKTLEKYLKEIDTTTLNN